MTTLHSRRFVVVGHSLFPGAADDLVRYLTDAPAEHVLHIAHSFSDAPDRRSHLRSYMNGAFDARKQSHDVRGLPEPFTYMKEFEFTRRSVMNYGGRWDRYIALDGLCALFGLFLRRLGRVRHVTLWNIDFVPQQRFAEAWKNRVYGTVNRLAATHVDEVWDLSESMVAHRRRLAGLSPEDYRAHRVVPIGIWRDRLRRPSFSECEQHTVVYVGHLLEKQGVQLVLEAAPRILSQVPDFQFKIIGTGAYEASLREHAIALGLGPHVSFLGPLTGTAMEDKLSRAAVGIAPYIRELDTFTQFGSDPTKVKTYLMCGLPVLVTRVPWIAREIQERRCGEAISEDPAEIADRIVAVLTDPVLNQTYRENAQRYADEFDYVRIFDSLSL